MSEPEAELVELDRLSIEVLEALAEHGGEATSVELRKYLGVEQRAKINYRFSEYLVPEGLIEAHQPQSDEPGRYPPKEIAITDHGEEYLETLDSRGTRGQIAERLDRLEEQVKGLRKENQDLREENRELKDQIEGSNVGMVTDRVEELTDDVDDIQSTLDGLQTAFGEVQTHSVLTHSNSATAINTGYVLGNVCRELLEEEFGEQRVMEKVDEKKEKFANEEKLL